VSLKVDAGGILCSGLRSCAGSPDAPGPALHLRTPAGISLFCPGIAKVAAGIANMTAELQAGVFL